MNEWWITEVLDEWKASKIDLRSHEFCVLKFPVWINKQTKIRLLHNFFSDNNQRNI